VIGLAQHVQDLLQPNAQLVKADYLLMEAIVYAQLGLILPQNLGPVRVAIRHVKLAQGQSWRNV